MNLLKKILLGLVVLVGLLVVVGFLLPSTAHVERSVVIEAPQSTVFALVNSYSRFNDWSPWAEKDPDTKYTYGGPERGVGAKMSWESEDPNVGNGHQEIVVSEPFEHVETELDFGSQGTAQAFFDFAPEGDATKVTWGFDTSFGADIVGRYFGLFMDRLIGGDYEKGLANLKALAESLPAADWADLDLEMTEAEPVTIAYISNSTSQNHEEISQAFADAYGQISAFIGQHKLQVAGMPIAINTSWDETGYVFDAGIPIVSAPAETSADSPVKIGETYGGTALKVVHKGAYQNMPSTYEKIEAYLASYGLEATGRSWDEWVSDPGQTPEEELITHIYFPLG